MGLGDLIADVFGIKEGKAEAAKQSGLYYRGAKAAFEAARKIAGRKDPLPNEEVAAQKVADTANFLLRPMGLSAPDDVARLMDDYTRKEGVFSEESADAIIKAISGKVSALQLQDITGIKIDGSMPVTNRLMNQMGAITDVSLASAVASITAEVASIGQIDTIGAEIRSYMDYSGLSQITGFGYGMILNSAIGNVVTQEINAKMQAYTLDPNTLVTAYVRGLVDSNYFYGQMARNGYSKATSDALLKANEFYPAPQDFIRMAVRDAFNPAIVQRAKLDDQFPSAIVPYAKKAGMSEEILHWYWRAHWELPSPNMAYEMLHRGLINIDDLRNLLKAADYAPGYIDALIGISYAPYTRVDARRMWEMGVLTDAEFIDAMKEIGYDDKKARKLLEWQKMDSMGSEKDLSQATILNAYKMGLMSRQNVIDYLQRFGYDRNEAEIITTLEERKEEQKLIEEKIDVLIYKLSRELISEADFVNGLGSIGIPAAKAEYYKTKAGLAQEKRTKLPSKEEAIRWFKAGYISEADARSYLKRMGYRKTEENIYIMEAKG